MYLAVQQSMLRLMTEDDVGGQYVPAVTGPGALKTAMMMFLNKGGSEEGWVHKPPVGLYEGPDNRTVRVHPRLIHRDWVNRRKKEDAWKSMNMTGYQQLQQRTNISCLEQIYVKYQEEGLFAMKERVGMTESEFFGSDVKQKLESDRRRKHNNSSTGRDSCNRSCSKRGGKH
jgi:hypothetical protein